MSALLLSSLGVICSACDHYNPPGAQRCSACGTALLETPPARPAPSPVSPTGPRAGVVPVAPSPMVPSTTAPAQPATQGPPGMRPVPRTPAPSAPHPALSPTPLIVAPTPLAPRAPAPSASDQPIPASELVRRTAPAPAAAPAPRFGISIVEGYARGQRFRLAGTGCLIGRSKGAILFPEDPTVSPHHATILVRDGRLFVRDEGSLSGVFVTIGAQEVLFPSGFFSVGQRLFRYLGALASALPNPPGTPTIYGAPMPSAQVHYAVEEVVLGGRPGRAVVSPGPLLTVGQQHCDFSYPNDERIAPRHCELIPSAASASLRDLSAGLGTFVRMGQGVERPLAAGDRIRIGAQILQIDPVTA